MQWYQNRGTLESCRAGDAYKLPGAVSGYISSESIPKGSEGVSVKLQLDNQTAVAYINNMGGTVSPQLTNLSKARALSKDIVLTAKYIPGSTNCVADAESRTLKDRTDWKLNPLIFRAINQSLGPLEAELFASRL